MQIWTGAWGAPGRPGVRLALALVATLAASAAGTRAEAADYRWKNVTNTTWNNPANWERTDGGPAGGFPNTATDTASFPGPYAGPIIITIPANVTIRIGRFAHGAPTDLTIAAGTGARLVFDNGAATADISQSLNAILLLAVPVDLASPLLVHAAVGEIRMTGRIGEVGGFRAVTKTGGGALRYAGVNAYTGVTTVRDGTLGLQTAAGESLAGDVIVGDGAGAPQSARLFIAAPHQINDGRRVTVNSDGLLSATATERLGPVTIRDGVLQTELAGVTLTQLAMTGGRLLIPAGGLFSIEGPVSATSSATGTAQITRTGNAGALNLQQAVRTFTVTRGPFPVDLEIGLPVLGDGAAGLIKDGPGVLRFNGTGSNAYPGETRVRDGRMDLARTTTCVPGPLVIGDGSGNAEVALRAQQPIAAGSRVTVGANGALAVGRYGNEIQSLTVGADGDVYIGEAANAGFLVASTVTLAGGQVRVETGSRLALDALLSVAPGTTRSSEIGGEGSVAFGAVDAVIRTPDGAAAIDLLISARITGRNLRVEGGGVTRFAGNNAHTGTTMVAGGTLLVTGMQPGSAVTLNGGLLGGTGVVGQVTASGEGRVAPGMSPGRLSSRAVELDASSALIVELNGTAPGTGYDLLDVTGDVILRGAALTLRIGGGFKPEPGSTFTILTNDGADAIEGTFAGLPEGARTSVGAHEFTISYTGGDGNDIVLTTVDDPAPPTYYLAEGATSDFFDSDVLIANPHIEPAPVTLTFFKEDGQQITIERTVAPQSQLVVHVDEVPGLEEAVSSTRVTSTGGQTLFVERTMFWDSRSYAGHTGSAIDRPATDWFFAEGAQGYFDTFVLLVNPNDAPAEITLTFLLDEQEPPVIEKRTLGPNARMTVNAGDIAALHARTFGIRVHATQPVMAERAMYFASMAGRQWGGGHESAGVTAPSRRWYLAEGATGFFDTFILLSNPQATAAKVTLQYLLTTGETITIERTIAANGRTTVNPEEEADPRLQEATFSTVVQSDQPIVAERSMYWDGATLPWGEAHNSFGVVEPALHWGLAEGRLGGPRAPFSTYILLGNPQATDAKVTVTFLREQGAPIVREYDVPATGRFTIDTSEIEELRNSTFGAAIDVTNNIPIVVERSMYWDGGGIKWSGGTNATGIVVP